MSTGGPGPGSPGSGPGEGQGSHQRATTSSAQRQQSTTAYPRTRTAIQVHLPTHPSSPANNQKIVITGCVIGGVGGLVLIAVLISWLLSRRQEKRKPEKNRNAEPVTYADLNNLFAGVQFKHSNRSSQRDSLLRAPPLFSPIGPPSPSHPGVGIRSGEANFGNSSGDYLLPTYIEGQARASVGAHSLGRLDTSQEIGSETEVSLRHSGSTPAAGMSPQITGDGALVSPQQTRDTMGFPIDDSEIVSRASSPGLSIMAPVPRYPLAHQDSLERVVREGLTTSTPELQDYNLLGPRNGPAGRVLSQELMRESPVLGHMNPVRVRDAGPPSN